MYSAEAFKFLQELLPLPSENTLRIKYATRISQLQDDLTDLPRIEKVIAD
jgi:cell division protein FtsX